jgi:hypothetical protein
MTTKFKGAVFILREGDNASELAEYISHHYFRSSEYHFTISDAIPASLAGDSELANWTRQALIRETGAKVMLFYPFKDKSIVAEKKRNGQIPS